ncbi:glycosyltransferase family 4 protein [Alteromonas mediterranea]|jgi:glycosyltransferase involved in cell wall biosynthesis|uniref:glycosyltransferase family 4 protein n=1 Tax=Alteromonas mediterranea TaxID=314275 RepID=UPI00241C548E|nr:glycosyltransferase family 1 protein [Alteromonas mediterranea]|tara:strand:- start:401 stop:1561 length:1161 start_codon:yes stop_codon:yes gene_type:complete
MKKKKVAIDARFVLRKQRGMPLYTFMLCKLIPKILYQHQFVLFINKGFEHNDSAEKYQVRLDEICKLDNVEIVNADAEDEISWEQLILPKLLKTHKVDLLHMPGNRVCLFTRVKQITTTHDLMEWHSLKIFRYYKNRSLKENFYFFRQKAYLWAVYRLGLSFSDHVLTISQYSKRDITQSFPKLKNKSSYVYHGIPRGFKPPLNNTSKQGVLMLGGDSHQKNPENMLKAWAQLPKELKKAHPLTILGFVGGEDSIISKTIRALEIENDIVIKGWVTEDELIQAMQTSKVFVFASREEGFGFPLVQSMASGTPVVTSEADVLIEIGQDAICSAKAEDFLALSSAVRSLLTDDKLYNEKVQKGLTISSKFTWEHTAEHIASTYLTLLK